MRLGSLFLQFIILWFINLQDGSKVTRKDDWLWPVEIESNRSGVYLTQFEQYRMTIGKGLVSVNKYCNLNDTKIYYRQTAFVLESFNAGTSLSHSSSFPSIAPSCDSESSKLVTVFVVVAIYFLCSQLSLGVFCAKHSWQSGNSSLLLWFAYNLRIELKNVFILLIH